MWAARNIQRHCLKAIPFLQHRSVLLRDVFPQLEASTVVKWSSMNKGIFSSILPLGCVDGSRSMSTSKGRSMRSKVEKRMRRETGKTLREIRRAKKLRKKLMTDEERLIYNLRRAKKKVALLLQKLKKYELPELPTPRHDPELLTIEQLQAYKKIGFRNRNYVPVGVRGVFGGVVQNMHLHWKFHETVQVCCDNFPKEKIKEMATMLARLSGGIVVNIHDVKTIIMFRGRNYRQPKNLIPINTLTKRKALFKARFEQALDSQKLNIKKLEQQLRRMGVNPEDPVAMASIQRVASTFFRAIDEKQGSPYVFHGDKQPAPQPDTREDPAPSEDSDQEELDRFIAEIEDAADQEWEAEEAAEKEELGKMRYWNREDMGGRGRRVSTPFSGDSEDENRGGQRDWKDKHTRQRSTEVRRWDSDDENAEESEDGEFDSDGLGNLPVLDSDSDSLDEAHDEKKISRTVHRKQNLPREAFKRSGGNKLGRKDFEENSDSDQAEDSEDASWESDVEEKHESRPLEPDGDDYFSSSGEER
ncbi:RNA-binding CRS1 / YhbY (CRM) domain protein [Tasmannia lanceolata]|uniref:RNA-binding CRS1 / YhbY (CRM) domain protein n=1 Tax=Tasmannia lanceolata TaxID=3420 RepID=UPI00406350FA